MHELSVTQSLLDLALKHANQAGATKISSLNITIGDLTSIIDDSVKFYWDIIAKDTMAEGAELNFTRIDTILRCKDCSFKYSPEPGELACPECKGFQVEVISGKEFYLDSIDIEN
jgi:hydrogenase nickel incorporation protein HypA/HybF